MSGRVLQILLLLQIFLLQSSILGQELQLLLEESDRYTQNFENEKSLLACQQADEQFPDNWEVKWRLSRALVNVAMNMPTSTDEQEDEQFLMYENALNIANEAVLLAPDKSICYLRRAIANGRIALFKGVFTVGEIVDYVRDDCKKAIELGNGGNFNQGLAHYVLARTHAKISEKWAPARSVLGLGWADIDSAIVQYKNAIELNPNFTMFYVDYGIALMREDSMQLAKKMFDLALEAPNTDINDHKRKEEAKELLIEVNEELE